MFRQVMNIMMLSGGPLEMLSSIFEPNITFAYHHNTDYLPVLVKFKL